VVAALKQSFLLMIASSAMLAQSWVPHASGTTASMRGVSAVSKKVVWASGTNGTYLQTVDGGVTWRVAVVPDAEGLDFRDVQGVDDRMAYLLSSGPGDKSRIYKTIDGGAHWDLQITNPDPAGFWDAMAFWDARHGMVLGDPVDGKFVILVTDDGGAHWQRKATPPALPNEGAFAASGTCLSARGKSEAWFGTGGPGAARVFHSTDAGDTWSVTTTPIRDDSASAGIFSLAFLEKQHGVAVGGDYNKAADAWHNIAITSDGGRTWVEPTGPNPSGFRSAVAYIADRKMWIATGTSGSDVSYDNGKSWKRFDEQAYNAIGFLSSKTGWAVGPKGALAEFHLK
jgi:photosystem II stability/assembly factor-like uncharacterized protein